jgi:hypothetical protein
VARATAIDGGRAIRNAGLKLDDTLVGDPDPLRAIEDECKSRSYAKAIISTLPLGVSRWLKRDLPNRVRTKLELEVVHVASKAAARKQAVA